MPRILLPLILVLLGFTAYSQCQPSPAITNIYQPVGAIPLPTDGTLKPSNFFAYPGQTFSQVITALPPQSTTVANPIGFPPTITVNINWIRVTNINNLPAWVSYQCGGQLDPLDPCKMAYPTWSCVNAYANTANGKVPLTETPGTIYSLDVIVDANVTVLGTQSNYNGGSISLFILDSMTNHLSFDACNGGTLSANASGGFNDPGAFVYTWSNGASSENISNLQNGWYSCTVLDQVTGWTATDSFYVASVNPQITITDIAVVAPSGGTNGSITSSATGGTGNLTYSWSGPGGFTAQGASINNLAGGTYVLTVTDAAGCTKTKTYNLSGAGIQNLAWGEAIVLYPNPAGRQLHIKGMALSLEKMDVKIYQNNGALVYATSLDASDDISLTLPKLAAGTYDVHLFQGKHFTTKLLQITE